MNHHIDRIVRAFETLTPDGVQTLDTVYAADARFTDPFNDVRGVAAIQQIFRHMYASLETSRFIITQRIVQGQQCFLTWEFRFGFKRFKRGQEQCILGGSHLVLSGSGHVVLHRDYWDAAELYDKLPLFGSVMRWLKKQSRQ
jgi:hypothetical protein